MDLVCAQTDDDQLTSSAGQSAALKGDRLPRFKRDQDLIESLQVRQRGAMHAQRILVPACGRHGLTSRRPSSLKPACTSVIEKDIAKAEGGR